MQLQRPKLSRLELAGAELAAPQRHWQAQGRPHGRAHATRSREQEAPKGQRQSRAESEAGTRNLQERRRRQ